MMVASAPLRRRAGRAASAGVGWTACLVVGLLATGSVQADPGLGDATALSLPAPPPRVPLGEGFSPLELATTGVVLASGVTMMAFGGRIFGQPAPSIGAPAPGSFDRTWADRLHLDDGSGHRFLWRTPDVAGYFVLPYAPGILYGLDAWFTARNGTPRLFDDPNSDHRLFAYAEALGWTTLVGGIVKVTVGRQRPYATLDHPELAGPSNEVSLSFFSAHAAVMFAAASFVALDTSRRLEAGPLANASPATRALLGTVVPYFLTFGLASVVAVSRIIDQQHWPSDVLVGGVVGAATGHLVYLAHFDERGQPRRSRAPGHARLVPTPGGVALVGLLP